MLQVRVHMLRCMCKTDVCETAHARPRQPDCRPQTHFTLIATCDLQVSVEVEQSWGGYACFFGCVVSAWLVRVLASVLIWQPELASHANHVHV